MSETTNESVKRNGTKPVNYISKEAVKQFTEEELKDAKMRLILSEVYDSLSEKNYNPVRQLVGYVLTGDPIYITTHGNAREKIRLFDRFELIELILKDFYRDKGADGKAKEQK